MVNAKIKHYVAP